MKKILLAILIVCGIQHLTAQKMEIGVTLGAANIMGDLVESDIFILEETNLLYGINYRFVITENVNLRGDLTFSKLTGDEMNSDLKATYDPNIATEVNYTGGDFIVELFFGDRFTRTDVVDPGTGKVETMITDTTNFRPYLLLGVGALFTKPEYTITPLGADSPTTIPEESAGNPENLFMLSLGAGFRFDLNDNLKLNIEGQFKYGFNDYLDGVKQSRNNTGEKNDWMVTGGINLSYRFNANNDDRNNRTKR